MTGPVLVVAAHPDDEALGCGGTIAKWAAAGRPVHVLLMADGEMARDDATGAGCEVRRAAAKDACATLGATVEQLWFPDNRMDSVDLLDVVKAIEARIAKIQPTTVLTHHAGDVNVDHRVVHQAVLAACRPQPGHPVRELLYFEVPSSTEWQTPSTFAPNYFVDVSETMGAKFDALAPYVRELRSWPHPRSYAGVDHLARWRGATAGYDAAEAFMVGRILA